MRGHRPGQLRPGSSSGSQSPEVTTGLADDYDGALRAAIDFAVTCSDADWQVVSANDARSVGVVFDHIAAGNEEVIEWIRQFLGGSSIKISPQLIDERNATHAGQAAGRPRSETVERLRRTTVLTSHVLHSLSEQQLTVAQDFGWLGPQDVTFLVRQAIRHPQRHLQSIREALGR